VRPGRERKQCRRRPTEEQCDGMREQTADPTEMRCYIARPLEPRIALGAQRAGEENREEKKNDPANLAGKRRATARALARAW
jgi:hypothetical protein